MRVLIINKFLHQNGGAETYIFRLGECLKKYGHEVEYFGMDHPDRCVGNRVNSYTSEVNFHTSSITEKIKYSLKTIYSIEARKKIRRVLDDFNPDVCHINNFNYHLTPSIILEIKKWNRNCRIIYTAHDYKLLCPDHMCYNTDSQSICEKCLTGHYYNCIRGKCIHGSVAKSVMGAVEAYFWKANGAYEYLDKIVCISDFMKRKMDTNEIFKSKTVTLHNFTEIPQYVGHDKKDYILYFGRYSEEKGVNTLLKVVKELSDYQFVFAGMGYLADEINEIENIKNIGFVKGNELQKVIREAKVVVVPPKWNEPFGLTIIEALTNGTPVLGSNVGGISELIRPGYNGELFEAGNSVELKTKLIEMMSDYEKYCHRCLAEEDYSVETYVEKMVEIYTE